MPGPDTEQPSSVDEETALGLAVFFDQGTEAPIPTYAKEQLEYLRQKTAEEQTDSDGIKDGQGDSA